MEGARDPFANSPNKDRTLDNVTLGTDLLIVGETKKQNERDFDMTFGIMPQIENGKYIEPYVVSQLWKKGGVNPKLIAKEYDTLVGLYHQKEVINQLS